MSRTRTRIRTLALAATFSSIGAAAIVGTTATTAHAAQNCVLIMVNVPESVMNDPPWNEGPGDDDNGDGESWSHSVGRPNTLIGWIDCDDWGLHSGRKYQKDFRTGKMTGGSESADGGTSAVPTTTRKPSTPIVKKRPPIAKLS